MNDDSHGSLYFCNGNPLGCNIINKAGYYIVDINEVYTCEDGNPILCSKGSIESDECNNIIKGNLYKKGRNIYICLNYWTESKIGYSVKLKNGNFLMIKDNINIFGLEKNNSYSIVKVEGKTITLKNDANKYMYGNSLDFSLFEKSQCPTISEGNEEIDYSKIFDLF